MCFFTASFFQTPKAGFLVPRGFRDAVSKKLQAPKSELPVTAEMLGVEVASLGWALVCVFFCPCVFFFVFFLWVFFWGVFFWGAFLFLGAILGYLWDIVYITV